MTGVRSCDRHRAMHRTARVHALSALKSAPGRTHAHTRTHCTHLPFAIFGFRPRGGRGNWPWDLHSEPIANIVPDGGDHEH